MKYNNIQATISAFCLVKIMSINPKSVQRSEIECKTVKLKMIDHSYIELAQTKWHLITYTNDDKHFVQEL